MLLAWAFSGTPAADQPFACASWLARLERPVTGEHLLIVDDEDNLRSMLAAALQHHGFTVSTAANGRQALEAIPKDRPDLVLLDVMMPDLDGFEVCRRLRRGRRSDAGALPDRPGLHRGQGAA